MRNLLILFKNTEKVRKLHKSRLSVFTLGLIYELKIIVLVCYSVQSNHSHTTEAQEVAA